MTYSTFKAFKYIVSKVFNLNNIFGPIKWVLKVLFGMNIGGSRTQTHSV